MRKAERRALRASAGFTLLEVLAAFLIFAVLFTVLAGTASEAFRSEGTNRRRLEASLIADQRLAELEEGALEIGEDSEENDIFLITTSISPLTADMLGIDLDAMTRRPGNRSNRDDDDDDAPASSILSPDDVNENSPLLRIDLIVEWEEGTRTLEIRRSTVALDTSELTGFGAIEGGGGDAGESELGGDDTPTGDTDDLDSGGNDAIQRMIDALQEAGG